MAKVFQILVPDNTLVSRIISCENQVTELFVIDRADKKFVTEYASELNKPALYILVNRDQRRLYIGETDDSIKRLKNHEAKDFWTEAIIYHSTTDTLSTTEVKWLEAKTFEAIKELGYYDLSENKQVPPPPPLKRNQCITLIETFKQEKEYIGAAGYDFFLKKRTEKDSVPIIINSFVAEAAPLPIKTAIEPSIESEMLKNCFEPADSVGSEQYYMQFHEILDVLRKTAKDFGLKSYNLQVAMRNNNYKQYSIRRPERGGQPRKLYIVKIVEESIYRDVLIQMCKKYQSSDK